MDCSPPAPLSMGFSRQEYWSEKKKKNTGVEFGTIAKFLPGGGNLASLLQNIAPFFHKGLGSP